MMKTMEKCLNMQSHKKQILSDPRWLQVVERDVNANGKFYYSVKTTGIFCRPSCGARTAKPENVDFHLTIEDAEAAGFRACKRCKPKLPDPKKHYAELISSVCALIDNSEDNLKLAVLANYAGLSVYYFHRIFKSITGLTPKAYASAKRAKLIRKNLAGKTTVTNAIYASGYGSNSRFYESSNKVLGMKASTYRKGGEKIDIQFAIGECSLGSILVARSKIGVCAISIDDHPEKLINELQDRFPNANLIGGDRDFEKLIAVVVGFVETPNLGFGLPLDIKGTIFQQRVWQALRDIPCGKTVTYSELAALIGKPKAVRSVASACAANAMAVVIPCHRVIRQDGTISGYRWGVERKRLLLKMEADETSKHSDSDT